MKKSKQIILKKDIDLFLSSALINDTHIMNKIAQEQTDAEILLYGFEFSHVKQIEEQYYERNVEYHLNLLETLSSTPRLYPALRTLMLNNHVLEDLLKESNNKNDENHMNFDNLIKTESKNKNLWKALKNISPELDQILIDKGLSKKTLKP